MKLINKIIEVSYPLTKINGTVYLIGVNGKYEIRKFSDDKILLSTNLNECNFSVIKDSVFFVSHSFVYVFDGASSYFSLFYKSEKGNEIWFFNEDFIFETKRTENRREYEYSFINTIQREILWTERSIYRPSVVSNEKLFFTDISGVSFLRKEIENRIVVWSIDFSENRIYGRVINFNNFLVFPTVNQDLIGVDTETGKELWRLSNCNLHHQKQPITNYLVGLSSNSFGDNFYQVIDPINGKKITDKKFENFFYETTPDLACITETRYYFISNNLGDGTGAKSEGITHLGCINLQTNEIEWIEQIGTPSNKRNRYQKPEVHHGKLYLLDNEKNLHVYEIDKE